jgi:hypothetical protein
MASCETGTDLLNKIPPHHPTSTLVPNICASAPSHYSKHPVFYHGLSSQWLVMGHHVPCTTDHDLQAEGRQTLQTHFGNISVECIARGETFEHTLAA